MTPGATGKSVTRLAAMPFGPRKILAALAAAALALVAGGCGSDDKSIPPSSSDQLLAQLQGVRDQVESGDCELAKTGAIRFKSSVDSLPSDVQSDTKQDLNKLADNLIELTNDPGQCAQEGASGEAGVATTESSTTEESTTSETTTSTTTGEEETTTKPDEVQPAQPEQEQQQQQQSDAGSQGNQGGSTGSNIGGGGTGTIGPKPGGGGGG
jgi:hypothetical protein